MEVEIKTQKGDDAGTIDSLIHFLNDAKNQGATHYKMEWSKDPQWAFKWFETFRILSEEEIKRIKIAQLQKQIEELSK